MSLFSQKNLVRNTVGTLAVFPEDAGPISVLSQSQYQDLLRTQITLNISDWSNTNLTESSNLLHYSGHGQVTSCCRVALLSQIIELNLEGQIRGVTETWIEGMWRSGSFLADLCASRSTGLISISGPHSPQEQHRSQTFRTHLYLRAGSWGTDLGAVYWGL